MSNRRLVVLVVFAVLLALVVVGVAWAGQKVRETRPASADVAVDIELVAGSVRVTGWDRKEVEVIADLKGRSQRLAVDGEGDRISIEIEIPDGTHEDIDFADLEVKVPRGAGLEVETVSAPVDVSGVAGALDLSSIAGGITVRGGAGSLEVATVSGDIAIEGGGTLKDGSFESVSGRIEVRANLDPRGSFRIETVSGDQVIRVPAGVDARFEASTFSGDIENQLGPGPDRTGSIMPSKQLKFSAGKGGARVDLRSFSGTIRIQKQ